VYIFIKLNIASLCLIFCVSAKVYHKFELNTLIVFIKASIICFYYHKTARGSLMFVKLPKLTVCKNKKPKRNDFEVALPMIDLKW